MQTYIERTVAGKNFRYIDKDGVVRDKATLDRIKSLAIPPAWTDVRIATGPRAKVQATGIDSAGRRQYIYHASHREKQKAVKFEHIVSFAEKLPKLRRQVERDFARRRFDKRKVLACAVMLMDETYFRVGNQKYAEEHNAYGLTTLRSKHLTIDGETVTFDFTGKSGQKQHRQISNRRLSNALKKLDDMPGYQVFRYYDDDGSLKDLTSADVNAYIKEIMGDDYTAKDFRTWGGTLAASIELARMNRPETDRERRKAISLCVKKVARKLGNTPSIARDAYIDPRIFDLFNESNQLAEIHDTIQNLRAKKYLRPDEACALKALKL